MHPKKTQLTREETARAKTGGDAPRAKKGEEAPKAADARPAINGNKRNAKTTRR